MQDLDLVTGVGRPQPLDPIHLTALMSNHCLFLIMSLVCNPLGGEKHSCHLLYTRLDVQYILCAYKYTRLPQTVSLKTILLRVKLLSTNSAVCYKSAQQ